MTIPETPDEWTAERLEQWAKVEERSYRDEVAFFDDREAGPNEVPDRVAIARLAAKLMAERDEARKLLGLAKETDLPRAIQSLLERLSDDERAALNFIIAGVRQAAEAALAASRAESARLREAAQMIVDLWDKPVGGEMGQVLAQAAIDKIRAALGPSDFDPARDPCNWPENIR